MRRDLWSALRSLGRDRVFTLTAVSLLALTTGATLAVHAVVTAVVLTPLPFADPDRTAVIWEYDTARSTPVVEVGLGEAEALIAEGSPLESVAVFSSVTAPVTVVGPDARWRAASSWVSPRFFEVIGARPLTGRLLDAADHRDDAPRTAVISERYWRRALGGDPAVVGRSLTIQRTIGTAPQALEIVGVASSGVDLIQDTEIWLPAAPVLRSLAAATPGDRDEALAWYLEYFKVFYAIGRLRPGVTIDQAEQRLGLLVGQRELPTGRPSGVVITPIRDYLLGRTRPVLWTMLAGAALMMLLACSSVAGLHVFRLARRDRWLAVQLTLGADRRRLARQAVLECGALAVAAAAGAPAVAWVLSRLLVALAPAEVPRLDSVTVFRPSALVATAALAVLAALVSGSWPAMFVARIDHARVLTSGARTAMLPRERLLQRLMAGWQLVVSVVILTGAALFVRSVQHLERTPLGFEPRGLVAVELQPSAAALAQWDHFFAGLTERLRALRSIESAAAVARRPLSGPVGNDTIPVLEGQEGLGSDAPWRRNPRANLQAVTPGYFATIGARLLAGRDFESSDTAGAENVVIVGRSTGVRLWPDRSPVGARVLVPTQRQPGEIESPRWQTVVGVVEDVRYRGLTDPRLDIYLPAAQSTLRTPHLLVRGSAPTSSLVREIAAVARDLDPAVLTGEVVTMTEAVTREMAPWRFATAVLTAFGVCAAMLASLTLLGVLSLGIILRRRELGIRAALGASPARLRAHLLFEAASMAIVAGGIGVAAALAIGRSLAALLVGVAPHDPVSIGGAVTLTWTMAAAACLWPSRRVASTDPATMLREP